MKSGIGNWKSETVRLPPNAPRVGLADALVQRLGRVHWPEGGEGHSVTMRPEELAEMVSELDSDDAADIRRRIVDLRQQAARLN